MYNGMVVLVCWFDGGGGSRKRSSSNDEEDGFTGAAVICFIVKLRFDGLMELKKQR